MVATNVLSLDEAYQAIHLDTIVLLFALEPLDTKAGCA